MTGRQPVEVHTGPPWVLLSLEAGWGSWLLGGAPGGSPSAAISEGPANTIVRILGARQLAQAALIAARPSPFRIFVGSAVDALHATSMALLARNRPRLSRPALASAAVAALFSGYGAYCGSRRR